MPSPPPDAAADQPAPRSLLTALIDDAAVFPPGNAPLAAAIAAHQKHRTAWYADVIGPLLIPAAAVAQSISLTRALTSPIAVGIVSRPGGDPGVLLDAVDAAAASASLAVAGIERGWAAGWRERHACSVPVVLEVPRGEDQRRALDDIAASCDDCVDVRAKLRTGATETWAWPDETELATFLTECAGRDLAVKLTGGLHHAVRADHGPGPGVDPQHGLLNVLLAVAAARRGDPPPAVAEVLSERDAGVLSTAVAALDEPAAADIRRSLTAYGCCDVTDPVTDLVALALLEEIPA